MVGGERETLEWRIPNAKTSALARFVRVSWRLEICSSRTFEVIWEVDAESASVYARFLAITRHQQTQELLALLLVFWEQVNRFGVGAVAVTSITRANAINFDSGVDGEDGVEEGEDGAEGERCKGGVAELGGRTTANCEIIGCIEETDGRGGEARTARREGRIS